MGKTIKEVAPPIKGFIQAQEQLDSGFKEILNVLLEGDDNLDLKTHVLKPRHLAALYTLAEVLNTCEYTKSGELLHSFVKQYLRYMISYKRLSRGEIIKALTTVVQEDTSAEGLKKLITDLK